MPAPFPLVKDDEIVGSIHEIAATYVPSSFEEKLAKHVTVCESTGKAVDISYHTFGKPEDPMLLLISGLNSQSVTNFDSATCVWLSQQGIYVIRMDNRDVGLSTKFDDVPHSINVFALMLPSCLACGEKLAYSLDDMADDAAALIRYLRPSPPGPPSSPLSPSSNTQKAHVMGVSMGGMITQCLAARHPDLVASATLVMTNSGNTSVAPPPLSTLFGFLRKPKSDSVEHINEYRRWFVTNYLVGCPLEDYTFLELVEKEFVRSTYMNGVKRHMGAIQRAPCRDTTLEAISEKQKIPIHIVHGERDRLLPVGNAHHMAKLMPSAKLSVYPTMGHYFEPQNIQTIYTDIVRFIKELEADKQQNQNKETTPLVY